MSPLQRKKPLQKEIIVSYKGAAMKYCEKCKKKFDVKENKCPVCRNQLTEISESKKKEINEYEAAEIVSSMMITGIL